MQTMVGEDSGNWEYVADHPGRPGVAVESIPVPPNSQKLPSLPVQLLLTKRPPGTLPGEGEIKDP
jgi:hypothetical protein